MDAYSSLLNLNFMASLRTGSVVVDMMIAMLIPFISGLVARFFREWWPAGVKKVLECLQRRDVQTLVPANRDFGNGVALDLDENAFLQELLMNYIGARLKPIYEYGSYQYKRYLAASARPAGVTAFTLEDTLKSNYVMQTVPTRDREVDLNANLSLQVLENTDDAENADGGSRNDHGGGKSPIDGDKKSKLKQKKTTLLFRTHQSLFVREDAMMDFASDAVKFFQSQRIASSARERYLYQPLLSAGGLTDNSRGGGGGGGGGREATRFQRYPLSHEKTFATLFFPEKEKLIRLIHQFETKSGKFAIPGFPRKLILLLHGPPGTGKTSLVKAIAALTQRHIFSIPLARVQTNRQLLDYMFDTVFRIKNAPKPKYSRGDLTEKLHPERVIYMLEDVDAASEVVRRKDNTDSAAAVGTPTVVQVPPSASTARHAVDRTSSGKEVGSPAPAAIPSVAVKCSKTDGDDQSTPQPPGKPLLILDDDSSSSSDSDAATKTSKDDGAAAGAAAQGDAAKTPSPPPTTTSSSGSSNNNNKSDTNGSAAVRSAPKVDRVTITSTSPATPFAAVEDKLSIKGLLDSFRGILDAPGRIVILTTNHIEHLDPALLRPGVLTMKLHMGNFDAKCGVDMVKHYYASELGEVTNSEDGQAHVHERDALQQTLLTEISRVIEDAKRKSGGFSPAEVEQLCAENTTLTELLAALQRGSRREIF